MERRKPLKRGRSLKRKTALKSESKLSSSKPLKPRSPLKAKVAINTKPKKARSKAEVSAAAIWKEAIVARGCEVCAKRFEICEGALQAHHAIYQQHLRAAGLEHLLWDIENGLCVCYKAHRRHHNRIQPIERKLLRPENIAFADRSGLMRLIERYYPAS